MHLTPDDFRAIEQALAPQFAGSTQWNLWAGSLNIYGDDVEEMLDEAKDVNGLKDFEINAEIDDASIVISGGPAGSILEYEHSNALRQTISTKARTIEGIFRDCRRRLDLLPNVVSVLPVPGLKRMTRAPVLKVGQPGFRLIIDWNAVAQGVITNWLSHLGTAIIGFTIGFILGNFSNFF